MLVILPFTGKERDAETGLDYFGARYFSGAQGRFTSPDQPFADQSVEDPQSWNLYAYTRNNPLAYVDIEGHQSVSALQAQQMARTAVATAPPQAKPLAYVSLIVAMTAVIATDPATLETIGSGIKSFLDSGSKSAMRQDMEDLSVVFNRSDSNEADTSGHAQQGQGQQSTPGDPGQSGPNEPYNRKKHYGNTPTAADRKAVGGE